MTQLVPHRTPPRRPCEPREGLVGVPIVLQWFVSDPGGDFLGLGGTTPGLEFITSF